MVYSVQFSCAGIERESEAGKEDTRIQPQDNSSEPHSPQECSRGKMSRAVRRKQSSTVCVCAHSLTHSFTHLPTHSPTHSLTHSLPPSYLPATRGGVRLPRICPSAHVCPETHSRFHGNHTHLLVPTHEASEGTERGRGTRGTSCTDQGKIVFDSHFLTSFAWQENG